MKREEFLALRHWPALLSIEETAWVLGIEPFYVMILVAAKLLKPVGKPRPNGRKFFSRDDVIEHTKDHAWLGRVTTAIVSYNSSRNHGSQTSLRGPEEEVSLAAA